MSKPSSRKRQEKYKIDLVKMWLSKPPYVLMKDFARSQGISPCQFSHWVKKYKHKAQKGA